MADNIVSLRVETDAERLLRALVRTPATRARATSILREELKGAPAQERPQLVALITLLERFAPNGAQH